jgi:hypothetical protein
MDRNPYAISWEAAKNIFGIAVLSRQGDWFGAGELAPWIKYALLTYFIFSTIVTGWFAIKNRKEDKLEYANVQISKLEN